jgi:tetratricopeptide (TPR) repeat protein
MIVWPRALLPAYDVAPPTGWLDGRVVAGAAVVASALALIVACRRRAPRVALGLLLAGIALAPVVHGLGTQVVADRYLYVAMAGVAIAVGSALEALGGRAPRVAGALAVAGLCACTLGARARVDVWRNDVTLFTDAVATEPEKPLWHHLLGRALVLAGQAEAGRAEMARARTLAPTGTVDGYCPIPLVVAELARQRERAGDLSAAEDMLRAALADARPGETDAAAVDLAAFSLRRGDRGRARDAYLEAVHRDPDTAPRATEALEQLDREAARGGHP